MKQYTWQDYYDVMLDFEIADVDTLGIAIHFGGASMETMQRTLFYLTGLRSLEELFEEYGM